MRNLLLYLGIAFGSLAPALPAQADIYNLPIYDIYQGNNGQYYNVTVGSLAYDFYSFDFVELALNPETYAPSGSYVNIVDSGTFQTVSFLNLDFNRWAPVAFVYRVSSASAVIGSFTGEIVYTPTEVLPFRADNVFSGAVISAVFESELPPDDPFDANPTPIHTLHSIVHTINYFDPSAPPPVLVPEPGACVILVAGILCVATMCGMGFRRHGSQTPRL